MRVGSGIVIVLKSVPPSVGRTQKRARNLVPVCLGVLDGRDCITLGLTRGRPSSLGDPDGLGADGTLGVIKSLEEERFGIVDAVLLGVLEVWVGIVTNPVQSVDDLRIGAVNPGRPGIDVTDGSRTQRSARDGGFHLVDVGQDHIRPGTDSSICLLTRDRVTVQILRPDRDTHHEGGEFITVCGDGTLQGSNLLGDVISTTRGPETEQEGGALSDGGGNSFDGAVVGSTLNHGVQTSRGELGIGANELRGSLVQSLEIRLNSHGGSISLGGSVVEALIDSGRGGERGREGEKLGGTHLDDGVGLCCGLPKIKKSIK